MRPEGWLRWIYVIPLRLRSLFRRGQVDRELDEELRFHVEEQITQHVARGLSPADARTAALRALGGLEQRKEECRDTRRVNGLDHLAQDLRQAVRLLRRGPGFAAVAVLSLALGIGANTAIFSVIDTLILRRLPVSDPSGLWAFSREDGTSWGLSYPIYERFRDRLPGLAGIAASVQVERSNVTINGAGNGADDRSEGGVGDSSRGGSGDGLAGNVDPGPVRVALVSGQYFDLLGATASIGRTLTPHDDVTPGGHPVAVISAGYWTRRFAATPDIIGRTLTLHDTTYTIIGVAARPFTGDLVGHPTDVWMPFAMARQAVPDRELRGSGSGWVRVLTRLKPESSPTEVGAAATVVWRQVMQEEAERQGNLKPPPTGPHIKLVSAARGFAPRQLGQPLALLIVVVALVLVIACANVAALLLARSTTRQREIAVRLALGASRGRMVRQFLTESLLLALMGGVLGLLIAQWGTTVLATMLASGIQAIQLDLGPDARVLAFTLALSVLTGVIFGLVPAVRGSQVSVSTALAGRGAGADGSGASRRFTLGKSLVVAQIALSLALLIGAGLLARTLRNLQGEDLGYDGSRVLLAWVASGQSASGRRASASATSAKSPAGEGASGEGGRADTDGGQLLAAMQERIEAMPGVLSTSASTTGVLNAGYYWVDDTRTLSPIGAAPKSGMNWLTTSVRPRFFGTVGLPMRVGRDFTDDDARPDAPRVIVINDRLARFYFGDENPLGRRLAFAGKPDTAADIVGVVRDAKYTSPRETAVGVVYRPVASSAANSDFCLVIRTATDATAFIAAVRQALLDVDRTVPVPSIVTIDGQRDEVIAQERLVTMLSGLFAGLALTLACVGLYGVVAYTAARRVNEMGIRLTLGATRADVMRLVLGESAALALLGIAVGVPLALAAARGLGNRLFGVTPTDPVTLVTAVLVMMTVAMLAGFAPARRSARVDPMTALRSE